ncbi:MAG: redoxin domain-containing protein [Gammaproteobacteria bacterium]|nr:redoxin domain-containing protein [Gammaproteobacteria bacterium]
MSNKLIFSLLLLMSTIAQAVTPLADLVVVPEAARHDAPVFLSENLRGGNTSLADYKGKVILLNFWATWCIPCRAEMPGMETLWQKYRERGLVIAAVSVDEGSRGRIETFSKLLDLSFPILLDPESEVSDLYEVSNMPTSFLIDRNGKIISRIVGTKEWTSPEAVQLVEDILSR